MRDIEDINPYSFRADCNYVQSEDSYGKYLRSNGAREAGMTADNTKQHWGYNFKVVMKVRVRSEYANSYFFDKSSVQAVSRAAFGIGYDPVRKVIMANLKLRGNDIALPNKVSLSRDIKNEVVIITLEVYSNGTRQDGGKTGMELTVESVTGEKLAHHDWGYYFSPAIDFGESVYGPWEDQKLYLEHGVVSGYGTSPKTDWYDIKIYRTSEFRNQ